MSYTYEAPDFLSGQTVDEIHSRMLSLLPSDIDCSAGSIPWDFTRPSALEKAKFVEFQLNEVIKLIFPQWAYGSWLDYHGELRNLPRKEANCASGVLSVTGLVGTVIPTGFLFATVSSHSASVLFQTLEPVTISSNSAVSGDIVTISLEVVAVLGGISGNVGVDSVKIMAKPLSGISFVTNPQEMTGGTAVEEDDSYRERILQAISLGVSFTGCNADYVRWAKEVSGVGFVVVEPEWNDPDLPESYHYKDSGGANRCAGAVRLLISDENGLPANENILEEVSLHILGNDEKDMARLAPIGAKVTITAPEGFSVDLSAFLILEEGEDFSVVKGRILENLSYYWEEVATETQESEDNTAFLRYVKVGAVLASTVGIVDYSNLLLCGGTGNILVNQAQYPVTGEVSFLV